MSKVVRKETLHKYISMDRKSYLKIWILVTSIDTSIDSYLSSNCRAICPALVNNFSSLVSWSNFHGFNTRLEQHVSWSIKHILDLPKYKKSAFCQRISQLHKRITYVLNKWNTYVLTICFISCFLTIFYGIVSSSPDMISCNKFWTNELDLVNGAYVLTDISYFKISFYC